MELVFKQWKSQAHLHRISGIRQARVLVELHGWWPCHYHDLFEDTRFEKSYEPVREVRGESIERFCSHRKSIKTGLWLRKDIKLESRQARERILLDTLMSEISLATIKNELKRCASQDSVTSCLYVTRTAYRFLPEFIDRGEYYKLISTGDASQDKDWLKNFPV